MSLATLLQRPNARPVYLAEMTATERLARCASGAAVYDAFEHAFGTADTGQSWTTAGGVTMAFDVNGAYASASVAPGVYSIIDTSAVDYTYELGLGAANTVASYGPVFGYTDANNWWAVTLAGGAVYKLYKYEASVLTLEDTSTVAPGLADVFTIVRSSSGGAFTVAINGEVVFSVISAFGAAATKVGIGGGVSSAGRFRYLSVITSTGNGYNVPVPAAPTSIAFEGVTLTKHADRATAYSAGRGWVDEFADHGRAFVLLDGGDTPWSDVLVATYRFLFSTEPKAFTTGTYAHQPYEPRLLSLPNLSQRVEKDFAGVVQIGGGSLSLNNADGFFNPLAGLAWDGGATVLRMGVDYLGPDGAWVEMAWTDYEVKGTWRGGETAVDEDTFTVGLVEKKDRLRRKIPVTFFDATTYPSCDTRALGKPIPLAYGTVLKAPATCTNTTTRTFTLASHALLSIDTVYRLDGATNAWTPITPTTTTTASATFVLPGTWNGTDRICADLKGRKTGAYLMWNPVDVVMDILDTLGESYDATSFATAKAKLEYGQTSSAINPTATLKQLYLYLDGAVDALSVISTINRAIGAYLYSQGDGTLYYKVFDPTPGESLTTYDSQDILSLEIEYDHSEIHDSVVCRYAERLASEEAASETASDTSIKTVHGWGASDVLDVTVPFVNADDAQAWAQRQLVHYGQARQIVTIELNWKAIESIPGSLVRVYYQDAQHDIDAVYEVLEQRVNLKTGVVTLTLGDLHGYGTCGFWVADAAVLPTRFANLAGYGSGSLTWNPNWDPQIKAWAKQNVAYWTDANGFANSSDPDSYQPSRWF